MHIAIDARVIGSTTGNFLVALLDQLQDIDVTNRYSVIVGHGHSGAWTPRSPRFSKIVVDIPHHSWAEQTRLLRVLHRLAPDLVHFAMPQQPLLYRGRKITAIHDLTILRTRNPRRSWIASLAKRATGYLAFRHAARTSAFTVACSHFSRDDIIHTLGASPARVVVVHDAAVDTPAVPEPMALPCDRFLLHVGRFSSYKNLARLCAVHQRLRARHPGLGLVLVGPIDDDAQALMASSRRHGWQGIVFTGFVSAGQRDWLLAHAAAYVFPSFAEGFGLPGLEAMAHGAPVASSDATCLPEIYGDAALYFPPADEAAMATTIDHLLSDPALRERMIVAGHARAGMFTWRRAAQETLALYERAVAGGASRGLPPSP